MDYKQLVRQLVFLLQGETDQVAILANTAALLMTELEDVSWAGFYLEKEGELILGPFQGKPACIHIPLGKGVCGTAFATQETVRVPDVHAFPGHIACDSESASEIVIPLSNR
ncbi:MAG TPA: GAF domain-containing protein, partial [Flexilinea sp.]|nr:GAF domain-containing protein [Flexilinea sp.]